MNNMGPSITVFTIDNCQYCMQVMAALEGWNLPYSEISLSKYPRKRKDLLLLSGKVSVPQVFIYNKHVGGVDATMELLSDCYSTSSNSNSSSNPLERLVLQQQTIMVGLHQTSSSDSTSRLNLRLMLPIMEEDNEHDCEDENDSQEVHAASALNCRDETCNASLTNITTDDCRILLPDGTEMSVLETTEKLKQILHYGKRRWNFTTYWNCCTAEEIVDAFVGNYNISREEAVAWGEELHQNNIMHHVCNDHSFRDTQAYFFRLQCYHTPNILNSYRIWPCQGRLADPDVVMKRVLALFERIERAILGHDGILNYRIAFMCSDFPAFEDAICELQIVDLTQLKDEAMMAFGINLYNLLLKYCFMKLGVPVSEGSRSTMLREVQFNVGGHLYSLQDWLDGILRGNRRSPVTKTAPFCKKDARLEFALLVGERLAKDCRVHFAIHCWSRSRRSPPVKIFTAEDLDEELLFVAQAFCEDDDNVAFHVSSKQMRVCEPLRRYKSDFLELGKSLPRALLHFVHGPRKEKLAAFLRRKKSTKMSCRADDWAVGVHDFVPFDLDKLTPNVRKIQKCVRSTTPKTGLSSSCQNKHHKCVPPQRARSPSPARSSRGSGSSLTLTFRLSKTDSLPKVVLRRGSTSCDFDQNSDRTVMVDDDVCIYNLAA